MRENAAEVNYATTFFEIAEPRNFGLYPQRYIHIGDEINCSNIENWLKFLLKKLSTEKNQNSWKFLKIFIFFPKIFFGHLAGHWPANSWKNNWKMLAGHRPAKCPKKIFGKKIKNFKNFHQFWFFSAESFFSKNFSQFSIFEQFISSPICI